MKEKVLVLLERKFRPFGHIQEFSCMIMPIFWQYTDIYGVIVQYIADHLDPTNYLPNLVS